MYFPPPPPFFTLARAFLPLPLQLSANFQQYSGLTTQVPTSQACPDSMSPMNIRMAYTLMPQTLPSTLQGLIYELTMRAQHYKQCSFFTSTSCLKRGNHCRA